MSSKTDTLFYEQVPEWVKLMTINCTAQPIETHGTLAGISFIVDQATHTLRTTAILFLRDRGEKGLSLDCVFVLPQ